MKKEALRSDAMYIDKPDWAARWEAQAEESALVEQIEELEMPLLQFPDRSWGPATGNRAEALGYFWVH